MLALSIGLCCHLGDMVRAHVGTYGTTPRAQVGEGWRKEDRRLHRDCSCCLCKRLGVHPGGSPTYGIPDGGCTANRPVWAFSVGMADALPKPFRRRGAALQQERLAEVLNKEVSLRDHKILSGVYQAGQMPAPLRMVFRLVGGRFGDLRDWAAVDDWTDQITDQLAKPASSTSSGSITG